jgi:predicted negative regulator of RcsB-dependent stress response
MADNIGRMLKTVYLQINTRDYVKALKTIDDLIEDFPKSAIFYDIKGSIHVLRGEKNLAKGSYQKSLSLNANSPETKAALDRL